MNYKEKIEELIKDCNMILSDRILLPTKTGELELSFDNGFIVNEDGGPDKDAIRCILSFVDREKKHIIFKYESSVGPIEDFYGRCYWGIFKALFLTLDTNNEKHGFEAFCFRTLAFEGLK